MVGMGKSLPRCGCVDRGDYGAVDIKLMIPII